MVTVLLLSTPNREVIDHQRCRTEARTFHQRCNESAEGWPKGRTPVVLCSMSKAFTREDVDPPERSGRVRAASGLPPGAVNYITARGARRLRTELEKLRTANSGRERIAELERILASVTIVEPPESPSDSVTFGAVVTVQDTNDKIESYRIVGVDELDFEQGAVSWISPLGKALLAAELGERVTLTGNNGIRVVKIEYPIE
jgi:transcription elongation factor GreB